MMMMMIHSGGGGGIVAVDPVMEPGQEVLPLLTGPVVGDLLDQAVDPVPGVRSQDPRPPLPLFGGRCRRCSRRRRRRRGSTLSLVRSFCRFAVRDGDTGRRTRSRSAR